MDDFDYSAQQENKVVLVGDMGVGKTTIIRRFLTDVFDTNLEMTVGAANIKATVKLTDGSSIDLTIWDTAGQERYQSLIPLYLRKAKAVILVCDVTRKNTAQTLDVIYTSLSDIDSNCALLLVGNKIDLEERLDYDELQAWAKEHNMDFMPASAKTGYGINTIFMNVGNLIQQNRVLESEEDYQQRIRSSKKYCCF